ncbi:MAG: hypothetical protein IJ480_12460 [Clostridia bacterium]|nr:hypothetical protein [Clostridia bacterium]
MKKLFALLMSVCLLTGCTPLLPSPHGDVTDSDTVTLRTQFPVYAADTDRIQVILENSGDTNLEYGAEWAVEVQQGDKWKQIPFADGYGWIQPLYTLMPGGTDSFYVSMDMLDYDMKNGTYRIVKEVSGQVCTAEFQIGESPVSMRSPYGYAPMEDLPEEYSMEDAVADGVVLMHPDGTFENAERMETFLQEYILGVDTQIRFAHYDPGDEDELTLTDVTADIRFGNRRIRYTYDSTRVLTYNPLTYTHYLQYLTVDNFGRFWISNTLETSGHSQYSELLYEMSEFWGNYSDWADTVREHTMTTYNGAGAWSPDGMRFVEASPDDVLHFYVNIREEEGGERGYTADLIKENTPVQITEVVWKSDTVVMLVCSTREEGVYYYGFYDTEEEKLISATTSTEEYRFNEDMEIVITE